MVWGGLTDLGMGWLNSSENVTCVPVPRPLPGARGSGLKILSKCNGYNDDEKPFNLMKILGK